MSDALATTTPVENLTLVALTPGDVPGQQAQLSVWCKRKAHEAATERSDMLDNARIARSNNWAFLKLEAAAKRAERRQVYYEKLAAAVDAGYLIVPNFDIEVMAVRVQRSTPRQSDRVESNDYRPAEEPYLGELKPDLLPTGEGRYVDEDALVKVSRWSQPNPQPNDPKKRMHYARVEAADFGDVDFPILAVKPIVMDATARAMSLKIFDRIGVVTGRREDPVVVGQIIDPRGGVGGRWGRPRKVVSFFIAWWLDTRSL